MKNWQSLPQPPLHIKPLWSHQRAGYAFAYPLPASMCSMGMGCGKSATASCLAANWGCNRVLIHCPSSVRGIWVRELERHMPVPYRVVSLNGGSIKSRTELADKAWNETRETLVVVANYEMTFREPFASWCLSREWDLVILDESHKIKNAYARTSRHAHSLARHARRRLTLTGTLLAQQPLDAWSQYHFLDRDVFQPTYKMFRERYARPSDHAIRRQVARVNEAWAEVFYGQPEWIEMLRITIPDGKYPGIRRVKEFNRRIAPLTFQVRSEDVLDLPPLMIEERYGRLGAEGRRIYEQLEREFVADLGNGYKLHSLCYLSQLLRLQQVTSGFLPDDAGNVHRFDHAKADLLRELLEATVGEKMVVFCRFWQDLDTVQQVCASMKLRYTEISGRRKDGLSERGELADTDGCGVQVASGSLGIDLSAARYAAMFSPDWSLPNWDQCIKRLHRPGQRNPVTVYRLCIESSIDALIHSAIVARREVVSFIMGCLRNREVERVA